MKPSLGYKRKLHRSSSKIYHEVGYQLINLGIRPGGRDYTRFILLGRPRSGSNLLLTALGQHPAVHAYGELLQQPRVRWPSKMGFKRQQWIEHAYDEPQDYVNEVVFRKYPTKVKAVGFKLFYHHAREEPQNKIWPFLRDDRDLHVIHLRRRNLLKLILSRKLADRSGEWRLVDSEVRKIMVTSDQSRPTYLDYAELMQKFVKMRTVEEQNHANFSGHPILNLWYEDLADEFDAHFRLAQEFLQLEPRLLQPLTRKQAKRSLDEQIENYAELKRDFAGSEWAEFFDA